MCKSNKNNQGEEGFSGFENKTVLVGLLLHERLLGALNILLSVVRVATKYSLVIKQEMKSPDFNFSINITQSNTKAEAKSQNHQQEQEIDLEFGISFFVTFSAILQLSHK